MEFWSWVIAFILGLSAIVSPIATALINNHYQLELKKLDMYEDEKRKALFEFIKSCETYMLCNSLIPASIVSDYYSSVNRLCIYFDIKDFSLFDKLETTIKQHNVFNTNNELSKVVQDLSKQIAKK